MKTSIQLFVACSLVFVSIAAGCGEKLPENAIAPNGEGHVSGTPQERIASIEANASLSPEKKALYIKTIKERNNLP